MSFTNVYYKRTAATAKACYVCYRPATTVLATVNTVDFLYTCLGHLSDPGFATVISDGSAASVAVSPEEVAKVKEEWEEKQKQKQKKLEKEKELEKDKAKKDKTKETEESKEGSKSPKPPGSLLVSPPASSTSSPTHQRYALHRDFYAS